MKTIKSGLLALVFVILLLSLLLEGLAIRGIAKQSLTASVEQALQSKLSDIINQATDLNDRSSTCCAPRSPCC